MVEPIQSLNKIYPIQEVEPISQVGLTAPIRNLEKTINVIPNKAKQVIPQSTDITDPLHKNNRENKFIQGSEVRLERLKSIYSEKTLKQMGIIECYTCSQRQYVDVSNDPGVSFKTPTNIPAAQSFAAVSAHEGEHVANERANAQEENADILYQSVVIHSAICPECGTVYSSGGTTTTVVKKPEQNNVEAGQLVDMSL